MDFRYCWKYISSVTEFNSVLMKVIYTDNVIVVNMDSNFCMTLIFVMFTEKGSSPKQYTVCDNINKFLPLWYITDLAS